MASLYFGDQVNQGPYPNTGNWTDRNQFYVERGNFNKGGWSPGALAGRLPTEADDVTFDQPLLSNFPTTWSGAVQGLNLGSATVPATGTWSGPITNGLNIPHPNSTCVISGTISNGGGNVYGGTITSAITSTSRGNTWYVHGGTFTSTSINPFNLYCFDVFPFPNISSLQVGGGGSGTLGLFNVNCGSVNLKANTMVLIDTTAAGSITMYNSTSTLEIQGNSVISADISTANTGCYRYNIYGGTFLNSAPWVFGTTTTAARVILGYQGPINGYYGYNKAASTLTTSKNITIYSQTNISGYAALVFTGSSTTGGTFTGDLTLTAVTGQQLVPSIQGGTYSPTKTLAATTIGSKTTINFADTPNSYGFGTKGGTYSPKLYLSGIPIGTDILSTQLL